MPSQDVPTVIQVTQLNTTDALGKLIPMILVTFKVGVHGPFTLQIPSSQFTAAEVQRRMQIMADQVNRLNQGS